MGFEGFPLVIGWELTLACNLRCRHCGSSAELPRANELTLEECLRICDQLPALLVREVDFTGGEPLVRRDWPTVAARLAERGIKTQILTNGLALDLDIIAQMKDVGIVAVGFSMDGLEATHDYIRGREGLFHRVLAGIDHVLSAGLVVTVITTVNALNIRELPSLLSVLQSSGVSRWQVQPIFPLGRGRGAAELRLTDQMYLQLGEFVRGYACEAKESGLSVQEADSCGYFTELDTRETPFRGCPAGLAACGITSDGRVKGCLSLPDQVVEGDLRESDLWDIWFHPNSFAYSRQFSPEKLGPHCMSCDKEDQCRGGCSAMSYGSTGRFHNDPYCFYGIAKRSEMSRLSGASILPEKGAIQT